MATIRADFKDLSGAAVDVDIRVERLTGASRGDTARQALSQGVAIHRASAFSTGIELSNGTYLLTWPIGSTISRVVINVPTGSGVYDLWDLEHPDGPEQVLRVIRYGTSASATLDEAAVGALDSAVTRTGIGGVYEFGAGGFKYFVWPDELREPTAIIGFRDTLTGFPISMAGPAEGYAEGASGWFHRLLQVGGKAHRVYRTRQKLGGAISITVS